MLIIDDDSSLFDVCMLDGTTSPYYNSKINFDYFRSYITYCYAMEKLFFIFISSFPEQLSLFEEFVKYLG